MGHLLYFLSKPFHQAIADVLTRKFAGSIIERQFDNIVLYASVFVAFILLNFFVLLASLIVFEKLIRLVAEPWQNGVFIFSILLLLLISNQLVKYFFWTPHQQLLNILTPLLTLYFGWGILKNKISFSKTLVYSALSGVLFLVYGNAVLLLAAIVIGTLLGYETALPQKIKRSAHITIIFLSPTLAWILFLKIQGVTYYNHEVAHYRNFVWIIDGISQSGASLASMTAEYFFLFIQTFGGLIFPILIIVVALSIRKFSATTDRSSIFGSSRELLFFILMIFLTLLFYWLLGKGSYSDRYTYSAAPYLIVLAAIIINKTRMTAATKITLTSLVLVYQLYIVLNDPIHFSQLFYY
jgi:hypothetical protein